MGTKAAPSGKLTNCIDAMPLFEIIWTQISYFNNDANLKLATNLIWCQLNILTIATIYHRILIHRNQLNMLLLIRLFICLVILIVFGIFRCFLVPTRWFCFSGRRWERRWNSHHLKLRHLHIVCRCWSIWRSQILNAPKSKNEYCFMER